MITLDTETDGINTNTCKILELFIYNNETKEHHHYMFNPGHPINPAASAVNGITDDDVKFKPKFEEKAKEIYKILKGQTIISYNGISFDVPLIKKELERCGISWEPKKQIDCLKVFQLTEPNKKLSTAYKRYCGKEIENAHTASADVMATVEVFEKQKELFGIKALEKLSKQEPIKKEEKAIDLVKMSFGKYKGELITDIAERDKDYLIWCIDKADKIDIRLKEHFKKILSEKGKKGISITI